MDRTKIKRRDFLQKWTNAVMEGNNPRTWFLMWGVTTYDSPEGYRIFWALHQVTVEGRIGELL